MKSIFYHSNSGPKHAQGLPFTKCSFSGAISVGSIMKLRFAWRVCELSDNAEAI